MRTLAAQRCQVTFREIDSPHGHDSFLLEVPEYHRTVAGFLDRAARERRGREARSAVVASMVPRRARGCSTSGCGDGDLLAELIGARGCRGQGVEVSPDAFHACIARGIPVVQADIDAGLPDFDDASFDVVVLSQTLQATRHPARGAARDDARRAGWAWCRSPTSATGACAPYLGAPRADAGEPVAAVPLVRDAQHPPLHAARLRGARRAPRGCGWASGACSTPTGARPRRRGRRANLLAAGAVYLLTR